MVNAAVPLDVTVTGSVALEPTATFPKLTAVGLIVHCGTRGVWAVPTVNVAICITHGPGEVNGAVALLLPAVVTTLSSAIFPSGFVMIRDVNPLPAAPVVVATVSAPKISSFALLVVAAPLLALALFPAAPAVTSSAFTPRYSTTRTSGNAAARLNVTVTVLLPLLMFAA
jgi:hypothetical protein